MKVAGGVPFLLTIEDFVRHQGAAWGFTNQQFKALMQCVVLWQCIGASAPQIFVVTGTRNKKGGVQISIPPEVKLDRVRLLPCEPSV
jgi:hypothetical protein